MFFLYIVHVSTSIIESVTDRQETLIRISNVIDKGLFL